MDEISLAKYSMMRAATILRQIDNLVSQLCNLPVEMPDTEAGQLAVEAALELREALQNIDPDKLADRLNDESADAKEDIAMYGTRRNPVNKE